MEFDRLGVFTYSQEEGTPAARMDGQIDEETKLCRRDELMELQQEISADLNEKLKGCETDVLIEGYVPNENVYIGRGYGDAPDVDGFIFVSSEENLETGNFRIKSVVQWTFGIVNYKPVDFDRLVRECYFNHASSIMILILLSDSTLAVTSFSIFSEYSFLKRLFKSSLN
jgi:hypothetical protein